MRLGVSSPVAGVVIMDREEGLRVGGAGRCGVLLICLVGGDAGRDGMEEADTNVSLEDVELCDACLIFGFPVKLREACS